MKLKLFDLSKKNLEDYISVIDVISVLAKTQETTIKYVAIFLLNQKIEEKIPTYICDKYYVLHDDEHNWGKYTNTYQVLTEISGNEEFEDVFIFSEKNISKLLSNSYWIQSDLYNLKLFRELSIDFHFRIKKIIDLTKNKKLPVEKFENIEELTIDEVRELLGEDHRSYIKNDHNNFIISEFVDSLHRCFNYFNLDSNFDTVIEKKILKNILFENGIIIDGFNNDLSEQVKDETVWDEDYLSQLEEENSLVIDNKNDELDFSDFIDSNEDFLKASNKQKNYPLFYKNETFTVEEAACLISGYEVINVESKSNYVAWRNDNPKYVEAENWIYSLIRGNLFEELEHNFYIIRSSELKKYLNKIGKIIEGFNDDGNLSEVEFRLINENSNLKSKIDELSKEVQSLKASSNDVGIPSVGHASPEHYQQQRDQLLEENKILKAELLEKDQKIKELGLIQTTVDESKLGNTRAENNVTKLLLVLAKMADIDVSKPHAIHESLLVQAELLGVDKFPSDETIKKWLVKANKHKNSQNPS
ncbi:hypothetical protein HYG93_12840 [Acinetobacter sp. SwsAc6]|uniref:hypothetical protein n=1 Tax=Acinetobacter sp. SwsAc6 TaxID=2749439 RepID=UPI0015C1417A|nr:hypothetical protein [Acinetobacter sp. SwsAc6]NWK75141.1 hypothetical protein [Acinetobacter sp. SwsAc6]